MKFTYLLLIAGISLPAYSMTTLLFEDFEDSTVGYSISDALNSSINAENITELAFNDYYGRVSDGSVPDTVLTNVQGISYFGVEDADGVAGAIADNLQITWSSIDITNYSSLSFSAFFAEDDDGTQQDWDEDSSLVVSAQIDGGGFFNVFAIESITGVNDSEPRIDTDFDGLGDGAAITDAFTQYTAGISGTGSSLDLRVTISFLDGPDEDVALDNVMLTGVLVPEPSSIGLLGLGGLALLGRRRRS